MKKVNLTDPYALFLTEGVTADVKDDILSTAHKNTRKKIEKQREEVLGGRDNAFEDIPVDKVSHLSGSSMREIPYAASPDPVTGELGEPELLGPVSVPASSEELYLGGIEDPQERVETALMSPEPFTPLNPQEDSETRTKVSYLSGLKRVVSPSHMRDAITKFFEKAEITPLTSEEQASLDKLLTAHSLLSREYGRLMSDELFDNMQDSAALRKQVESLQKFIVELLLSKQVK